MTQAHSNPLADPPQTDTVRLWLSDQQWMSILSQINQPPPPEPPETPETPKSPESSPTLDCQRREPRHATNLRCVLRVQQPDGRSATYIVHTQNLSSGGIGFVHSQPIAPGTTCTVALVTPTSSGCILAGQVAWCRDFDHTEATVYEIGITFDQPTDVNRLIDIASTS